MIAEAIGLGLLAIGVTAGVLGTIHLVRVLKRKNKRQKLSDLHSRKMQILDEIKKEIEVEAVQKKRASNLLEVYDIQEVQT